MTTPAWESQEELSMTRGSAGGRSVEGRLRCGLSLERRGRSRWLALRCFLLAVSWLATAPSAFAAAPQDETFEDRSLVVEVQVPVNVTDRQGEPVRGLAADDFELLDNGRSQEIVDLRVVDLDLIEPAPGFGEVVGETIAPAARRRFLFLFDLSHSRPSTLQRARQAAQRFVLSSLHPTDLAAVATFDLDVGPELVLSFTPDRSTLARAIDLLGQSRGRAEDPLLLVLTDRGTDDVPGSTPGESAGGIPSQGVDSQKGLQYWDVVGRKMEQYEKSYSRGQIAGWLRSMQITTQLLASVPGRKHVVYFTEGFDGQLLLGSQPEPEDPESFSDFGARGDIYMVDNDDRFGNTQLQTGAMQLMASFRQADSVLQIVDISGLGSESASAARRRRAGRDALEWIAGGTGGEMFTDANELEQQLRELLGRTTVTYLLTFQPDRVATDGAEHRIKVKANVPRGSSVSYREGYFAPREFEELHPIERGLLAGDLIATADRRDDLELSVLAAPFRASGQSAYVPVIVEVRGEPLLVEHRPDLLPIEIYVYLTDENGEMRDFFSQMVTLDLSDRRVHFAETGFKYYGHLEAPAGRYLIRVLVRNGVTGRAGVELAELEVPEFATEDLAVLPPFFIEAPGTWFLAREPVPEGQASVVYPFTLSGQPYIPAARPALSRGAQAQLCIATYNLGKGRPDVATRVVDEAGEPVSGGELKVRERIASAIDGLDKLTATFTPRGLSEGDYRLEVEITDASTGTSEVASIPFSVEGTRRRDD